MAKLKLKDRQDIVSSIEESLSIWCTKFKLFGFPDETPRYSQLFTKKDSEFYETKNHVYELKSTQKDLSEDIDLNEEQNDFLFQLFLQGDLWDQYKELRTEYLIKNEPKISPY